MYDNYDTMSKFIDPNFKYHLSLGRLWLAHALLLVDTPILPFELRYFVKEFQKEFLEIEHVNQDKLLALNVSFAYAKKRMEILLENILDFEVKIKSLDIDEIGFYKLRGIHNIIQTFSQIFMQGRDTFCQRNIFVRAKIIPKYSLCITGVEGANIRRKLTLLIWYIDIAIRSLDIN